MIYTGGITAQGNKTDLLFVVGTVSHDTPHAIAGEMWHLDRGKRMRFKNSFRNLRTVFFYA